MRLLKLLHPGFLTLAIVALTPTIMSAMVTPTEVDSVEMQDYRRIWGSPSGCFYFLKQGGFEVRQYAQNKTVAQSLSSSQKLISSDRGSFFALITYSTFSPTELRVTEMRLYRCTGEFIWGVKDPGCTSFILSDESAIAVGIAGAEGLAESALIFFGSTGNEVGAAKVDNFSSGRFSDDGEFFFAISGGKGLIKFTTTGKEVQRYADCKRYSVSRDGEIVAIYKDSSVSIYKGATLQTSMPVSELAVRDVRFSANNRYAAILKTQQLLLYDVDSLQPVWEYSLPDSGYQFFHFDSDSSFNYFACSTNNSTDTPERRNTRGQALLIGSDGKLVWQTDMTYVEWSVKYPEVKIDLPARILTLLTAEKFRIYSF
jgi:hypothetical protein